MNFTQLIITLIIFNYILSSKFLEAEKSSNNVCINRILRKIFHLNSTLFLINSNVETPFPAVYINTSLDFVKIFEITKPNIYLINLQNHKILDVLDYLIKYRIFNSRGQFIILNDSTNNNIFTHLSSYFIYNTILIDQNGTISMHEPFIYEDISGQNISPKILGNCTNFNFVSYSKIPQFWRNTSVRAVFYESKIKKMLFNLYKLFVEKAGFKNETVCKKNGTYTTMLSAFKIFVKFANTFFSDVLQSREAQILVNLREIRAETIQDFDIVPFFLGSTYHWVVAKSQRMPHWKAIFLSFNITLWLMILIFFILLSLIWYYLEKSDRVYSFLLMFQLLLECSVCTIGKIKALPIRLVILGTLLPFLVLSTSFKTELIRSLAFHSYEKQIKTFKDIVDNNLSCNISHNIKMTYNPTKIYKDYIQNCATHEYEENNVDVLKMIITNRNLAGIARIGQYDIALSRYFEQGSSEQPLYLIPQPVIYYYVYLYLSKGSPFYKRFIEISGRLLASGFREKIFLDPDHKIYTVLKFNKYMKAENLTLEHLSAAFCVLAFGLILSFAIFLGEIVMQRKWNKC